MQEHPVIIVGTGSSSLATAASLNHQSIPYTLLERQDRFGSPWTKYSYDRLHLPKQFGVLPHMPFPASFPTYVSKDQFIHYLDGYTHISHFNINPLYGRCVELARFDEESKKWVVQAKNLCSGEIEEYSGKFLVLATGVTADPYIPQLEGLHSFAGTVNRCPVHVLSRKIMYFGSVMSRYFPGSVVDSLVGMLEKLVYRDLSKYDIRRPKGAPLFNKVAYGNYPVVDHMSKICEIKSEEIQEPIIYCSLAERSDLLNSESETRLLTLEFPLSSPKSCSDRPTITSEHVCSDEVLKIWDEVEKLKEENKVQKAQLKENDEEKKRIQSKLKLRNGEVMKLRVDLESLMEEIETQKVQIMEKENEKNDVSINLRNEVLNLREQVEKLKEEEQIQKAELMLKDEEKREVIRQLSFAIEELKDQNVDLRKRITRNLSKKRKPFDFNGTFIAGLLNRSQKSRAAIGAP